MQFLLILLLCIILAVILRSKIIGGAAYTGYANHLSSYSSSHKRELYTLDFRKIVPYSLAAESDDIVIPKYKTYGVEWLNNIRFKLPSASNQSYIVPNSNPPKISFLQANSNIYMKTLDADVFYYVDESGEMYNHLGNKEYMINNKENIDLIKIATIKKWQDAWKTIKNKFNEFNKLKNDIGFFDFSTKADLKAKFPKATYPSFYAFNIKPLEKLIDYFTRESDLSNPANIDKFIEDNRQFWLETRGAEFWYDDFGYELNQIQMPNDIKSPLSTTLRKVIPAFIQAVGLDAVIAKYNTFAVKYLKTTMFRLPANSNQSNIVPNSNPPKIEFKILNQHRNITLNTDVYYYLPEDGEMYERTYNIMDYIQIPLNEEKPNEETMFNFKKESIKKWQSVWNAIKNKYEELKINKNDITSSEFSKFSAMDEERFKKLMELCTRPLDFSDSAEIDKFMMENTKYWDDTMNNTIFNDTFQQLNLPPIQILLKKLI